MRAYLKSIQLSMGMMEVSGDLYGPKATSADKEEKFTNCCPTDGEANPTKMVQRYICPNGHDSPSIHEDLGTTVAGFPQAECLSGQFDDKDQLRVVGTKEEVKEAKASELEKNQLELVAHFADELEPNTFPTGVVYVFVPSGKSRFHPVLLNLVDQAGLVQGMEDGRPRYLVGRINLKGHEKLVRLQRWDLESGPVLVIQELVRPEDLKEGFEGYSGEVEPKVLAMARQLIEIDTETFDPATYVNTTRNKLVEWAKARAAGGNVVPLPIAQTAPATKDEDLEDALAAALAAAQAKKQAS